MTMQETAPAPHETGSQQRARSRFVLLVIDPDKRLRDSLVAGLMEWQVDVLLAQDPADGLLQAGQQLPDAVLTAADVPPMRGSEIARALLHRTGIATIVGVGESDGPEASLALAAGATACVARPYRVAEVLMMLRAMAPEHANAMQGVVRVGALRLDPNAREVWMRDRHIALPMREFELLQLLMNNPGRVVTRQEISRSVWGGDDERSNTVTVHIRRLRSRLGDRDSKVIVAIRGLGYRLDPP